jgi:hypothetical protein
MMHNPYVIENDQPIKREVKELTIVKNHKKIFTKTHPDFISLMGYLSTWLFQARANIAKFGVALGEQGNSGF